MPDTIRSNPQSNYTPQQISERLEKAGELRKHIKKYETPGWIAEILREYLPVKNEME